MSAYGEDLAYIHDKGFGDYARNAAPGLLRILRRNRIRKSLVVDLGCGSGIWARELSLSGYDVLGVDVSPSMVRLARRNAPEARFVTGSLLSVSLPPCGAVTAIGECVNYLLDPASGKTALQRLFHKIYRALCPGGILAFDFAQPGMGGRKNFFVGEDWAVLSESVEHRTRRELTRNITFFRKIGSRYRRGDEIHKLRLYDRREMMAMVENAGFRARLHPGYGSFRLPGSRAVIVAVKLARR